MNRKSLVALVMTLVVILLFAVNCGSEPDVVSPDKTGHWKGEAEIIMTWVDQEKLTVDIQIDQDGSVRGTVGDAKLIDARFQKNRGVIGKKLNVATDFIIRGKLEGPIVKAENITREEVFIPLNLKDGNLQGSVATSGLKLGGKKEGPLSAKSLVLELKK